MKPATPVVTIRGVTYAGATLTWSGSASKYTILGATGTKFTNGTTLATNITGSTGFVRLPQAGSYSLVVVASNGGTYTTASASKVAAIPFKPLPAPTLTAGATYNGVALSWSAVAGNSPVQYAVIGGGNSGIGPLASGLTGRTFFASLPTPGVRFTGFVNGYYPAKALTPVYSNTVEAIIPYKPPTVPVIKSTVIGYEGVTLSWTASTSNTPVSYRIGTPTIQPNSTTFTGLTGFIGLTGGVTYSARVFAYAGPTLISQSGVTGIYIPVPKAPSVPVVTVSGTTFTGTTLSWPASSVVQALPIQLKYDIVSSPRGTTYASNFTGLTYRLSQPVGSYDLQVIAKAGITFSTSELVSVVIPLQKPSAPVVTKPVVRNDGGVTLSWAASRSNTGITYGAEVYFVGSESPVRGVTGLAGTSVSLNLDQYGPYAALVTAYAGDTFTSSLGVTFDFIPPAPEYVEATYLTPQYCQLIWNPPPVGNDTISYEITEIAGNTFRAIQPMFDSGSNSWSAGISFGEATSYNFFVKGSANGLTGQSADAIVNVPTTTQIINQLYDTPGTYTLTMPFGFSGVQAQLVGAGGGGGGGGGIVGSGGGGGAGAVALTRLSPTAGTTFALIVGAGGIGSVFDGGDAGGSSSLNDIIAGGGGGGGRGQNGDSGSYSGVGGAGGTYSDGQIGKDGARGDNGATPTISGGIGGAGHIILGVTYGGGGIGGAGFYGSGANGRGGCVLLTFFP